MGVALPIQFCVDTPQLQNMAITALYPWRNWGDSIRPLFTHEPDLHVLTFPHQRGN